MTDEWTADFGDDDITFFMLMYHDFDLAHRCLADLRAHFPRARVVVRSDGDPNPRHGELVDLYAVEYLREPRLFAVENGAAVVRRMLELFAERPTRFMFKIDPDTVVQRRFRFVPAREGHFGTLQGPPDCVAVQGGCMGFTPGAVAALADCEFLRDPRLADPCAHRETDMYFAKMARRADKVGLSSFDWSLGWAATALGVEMFEFPEVRSQWKVPVDDPDRRFAIVHPRAPDGGEHS
jgi:hypothetical protein